MSLLPFSSPTPFHQTNNPDVFGRFIAGVKKWQAWKRGHSYRVLKNKTKNSALNYFCSVNMLCNLECYNANLKHFKQTLIRLISTYPFRIIRGLKSAPISKIYNESASAAKTNLQVDIFLHLICCGCRFDFLHLGLFPWSFTLSSKSKSHCTLEAFLWVEIHRMRWAIRFYIFWGRTCLSLCSTSIFDYSHTL